MHPEVERMIYQVYNWLGVVQRRFRLRKNGLRQNCSDATGASLASVWRIVEKARSNDGQLPDPVPRSNEKTTQRREEIVALLTEEIKRMHAEARPVAGQRCCAS
jgi:hypothetical protein